MGRKLYSRLSPSEYGQLSIDNYDLLNILENQKCYKFIKNIYPHKLPIIGQIPNSTQIQKDENGNIVRIRYYDENGNAYKDIDYTDHGTPEIHKVPHTHIIEIGSIIDRKKGAKSYGERKI